MESITLKITGLHCAHCVRAATEALQDVSGVKAAQVNLQSGLAEISFDSTLCKTEDLAAALKEEGYGAEIADI